MKAHRRIVALLAAVTGLLLNVTMVMGAAGEAPSTNPSLKNDLPTQVVIIGALHDFHQRNPHYSLEVLTRLIASIKPQAILVELPETSGGKPTVKDGRLVEEYAKRNEFRASQQAAETLQVEIYPFDMDRLDDIPGDFSQNGSS
jgi:hypothetical protein